MILRLARLALLASVLGTACSAASAVSAADNRAIELPAMWEYSAPLIAPNDLRFVFQGMLDAHKAGEGYGRFQWRIGMLTPVRKP